MPSEQPWKLDAIMRLLLSVFVCYFCGAFLVAAVQHVTGSPSGHAKVMVLVVGSLVCLGSALWLLTTPWDVPQALTRSMVMMGLFALGLSLGRWASVIVGPIKPSVVNMIVSALSLQGAALILLFPFLRDHETTWARAFGLRNRWPMALFAGIVVASVFTPIAWKLQDLSARLMTWLHLTPHLQQAVQTLGSDRVVSGRWVFAVVTVVLVPVAEEAFFRGILYTCVKRLGYRQFALWSTSILFAAVHANMAGFIPLALLAVLLALLYERCGNLLAPISAHAVFNAANLARFYLLERAMNA